MKKVICILLIFMVCFSAFSAYAGEDMSTITGDLAKYKIMVGNLNGELELNGYLTRAQVVKMIVVALGYGELFDEKVNDTEVVLKANTFSDVTGDHWAYEYVEFAYQSEIILGRATENGADIFSPDDHVTYVELLRMLIRAIGYEEFAQARGGDIDSAYVACANQLGMIDGISLINNEDITRGDAARIIYNTLDIPLMEQVGFGADVVYAIMDGNAYPLKTLRTVLEN